MGRPVRDSVVVITGASSGIGRETALAFARAGARVVLAARGEGALEAVAAEVERLGGSALVVPTDVSDAAQVEELARRAAERFGRIDTWVNNAGVSLYGEVTRHAPDELERVIRVNLLGTMHGCKAALPYLRRAGGGLIVNVGSVLGERAIPLQAAYVASKHGVSGFTEALRLELERSRAGVDVTLVLPSAVDTPLFERARSRMAVMARPIPPVYAPAVVARAILSAAERPLRTVVVGSGGRALIAMQGVRPSLVDRFMLATDWGVRKQMGRARPPARGNLFVSRADGVTSRGRWSDEAREGSVYTRAWATRPRRARALAAGALLAGAWWLLGRRSGASERRDVSSGSARGAARDPAQGSAQGSAQESTQGPVRGLAQGPAAGPPRAGSRAAKR